MVKTDELRHKQTYTLSRDAIEAVREAVKKRMALSQSRVVENAIMEYIKKCHQQWLAKSFDEASKDPLFLKDIEEAMSAFALSDREV